MISDANYRAKQNKAKGTGLKILTLKQMLQRLPIALAQIKPDNNSIYSLYQSKENTKKVYNNFIKSL